MMTKIGSDAVPEPASSEDWVLRVRGLRVELPDGGDIVDDVRFDIRQGEVMGLVGEPGSGKTTVAMALLGYARGGARIAAGQIWVRTAKGPVDLLGVDPEALRQLRGAAVAYVPQDPAAALNPAMRVGAQLAEALLAHLPDLPAAEVQRRIAETLTEVGLPATQAFQRRYPHQLSGGQQQRIGIAMAFIIRPAMIVLDEPTTGLDVTTQNRILEVVRHLCDEHQIGALHVTHDLSVISAIADRIMVMYSGRAIEIGRVVEVFDDPRHPYTQALLNAVPELQRRNELVFIPGSPARPGKRPEGCFFAPRCALADDACRTGQIALVEEMPGHLVRCRKSGLTATPYGRTLPDHASLSTLLILSARGVKVSYGPVEVLSNVTFDVMRGECLAIVGESGSGKSTLSRALVGLVKAGGAGLFLHDEKLAPDARGRSQAQRQQIQYIFQSPFNSLYPRQPVEAILGLVHDTFSAGAKADRRAACIRALEQVGLPPGVMDLFPDELSGGERQRVSIARALLSDPDVLVCDEITSALDVSVQASIITLLDRLRRDRQLTIIFVTHDLALVRNIANRVLVLDHGVVAEIGEVGQVIDRPTHPYSQQLLRNALEADLAHRAMTASDQKTAG